MATQRLATIATRHQVHLERLKTSDARAFDKFLRLMANDIRMQLSGDKPLTEFRLSRLNAQIEMINKLLRKRYGSYHEVFREQLKATAVYEAEFEAKTLKEATGVNFKLPTEKQLGAVVFERPLGVRGVDGGLLLESFWEGWSVKTLNRVESAIRLGAAEGQTNAQIVQRILGTKTRGYRDGILDMARKDATMLVRTATQHASAQARQATWEANSDIVTKVRWTSTLDNRTTPQCQSLDGREFPIDKGPRPPIHVGCRSTTVAVLDKKFAALSEGGTRAARDADGNVVRVPANQTYYDWLKTQPAAFQDSAIGPVRGKLLREGGLSAERFAELQLGRNFEPLPLYGKNGVKGMADLEPVAFERAGL